MFFTLLLLIPCTYSVGPMKFCSMFEEKMFDPWLFGGFGHFHLSGSTLKLQAFNIARHLVSPVEGSPSPIISRNCVGIPKNGETPGLLWGMPQTSRLFSQVARRNCFKKCVPENREESEVDTPHVVNIELLHPRNLTWRSRQLLRGDEGPGVGEWPLRHVSRRNKLGGWEERMMAIYWNWGSKRRWIH